MPACCVPIEINSKIRSLLQDDLAWLLLRHPFGADLRETSDIDARDEVGRLAAAVNGMIGSLRGTVCGILQSAEGVAAAAQQISASTEEIASGSTARRTPHRQ
ncbi:HAMP domain-containing protein [Cohnella pontilimi]|uniref:HAMP domain-containing protein n=1 Tax=Cohnella pontilimi TaxID=2564100 RepID=UPI003CCC7893